MVNFYFIDNDNEEDLKKIFVSKVINVYYQSR